MPKNYSPFLSVPYEVGDVLVINRTWLPDLRRPDDETNPAQDAALNEQWDEFLKSTDGKPFSDEIERSEYGKKLDFFSHRITFKVTNIYSYGVGREITGVIKWSNVVSWAVGSTLTFVLDDTTLRNYRYANFMFQPNSYKARKKNNLWKATTNTPLDMTDSEEEMRKFNNYDDWFRNPILNNNCEYREELWNGPAGQQPTYHIKCARLKGNDTNFFTIQYAVQGRLIEFIKRMAHTLKGRTVTKLDEMGYFTLGLRKKRELETNLQLSTPVSQEIKWSKEVPLFGSRENMDTNAYFVLSAIGVTNPDDLNNGARIANTENINAYEVICYRSRYAVMEGPEHELHNIKYRLRITDEMLYGANPHIEYVKTGDNSTLHDEGGKPIKVVPEIYGFELRSHNRAQPVSSLTFNLRDRETNAFIKPRVAEHWKRCATNSYWDAVEDKNISPDSYLAEDLGEGHIVDWSAALLIEYKPRPVCITVSEEEKADEKIFKTIYVPNAFIPEETPDQPMSFTSNSSKEWGYILLDAFIKKQGLRSIDPIGRPLYYIESFLERELREPLVEMGDYDEEANIFEIIGEHRDGAQMKLPHGQTAQEYYDTKIKGLLEKIYGDEANDRRTKAAAEKMFEPWALRLDPDGKMFGHVVKAAKPWKLYGLPAYIREHWNLIRSEERKYDCKLPEFSPSQSLNIIQLHVGSMNSKGERTISDMMHFENGEGPYLNVISDFSNIYPNIKELQKENTYLEIHIGRDRTDESTRGKKDLLAVNALKTFRVHMNAVSEITDAQHHTDELVSSRMDITEKMLAEYPNKMSFSMIHSVLADSNKAIDKAKCIALIKKYVPNSGLFGYEDSIQHGTQIPKALISELVLQEAGHAESMNLNQTLWDFILYVIGNRFSEQLKISDGTTLATLRQQVYSFRLTVRDPKVREARIAEQQAAYTNGTLEIAMGQMDEYFKNVSGKTFVLEKLSVKELNKSVGSHLKKNFMHPTRDLMKLDQSFTAAQCTNFNIEITMEPQQRRTYNAVEISMVTAVGPYISEARQIPTNTWKQTYKPALLRIKPDMMVQNDGMPYADWNRYQPPNNNRLKRDDILRNAGFEWDEDGQIYHDGTDGTRRYGQAAWKWVSKNNPGSILSRYEPDPLEVKALEARMTFTQKEVAGQIQGNHLKDTEDLHNSRKDVMRNTFLHVRNLDSLAHDVYRKVPRSQETIAKDWRKYQTSQFDNLKKGLQHIPKNTDAYGRDLILKQYGVLTPQQYESGGNSLLGPFQSAEPYADDTGKPGKMESDFWALSKEDIEVELNKDNYGRVGYLLNHFIRSRRCHQMDIANRWFKATLSIDPNAPQHEKYAMTLDGRFNYLRWRGSGVATTVGPNGTGKWPKSNSYILNNIGNILVGMKPPQKKARVKAFYIEINRLYQEESQQFITHLFKFPDQFNKGINWRTRISGVQFFRITDVEITWDHMQFIPRIRVQGIINIIDNIIHKRYKVVTNRMKERNKKGQKQLERDVALVGKSSVENLIEGVWNEYSGFMGKYNITMEGRNDYSLQTAGFPEYLHPLFRLRRLLDWASMRQLFDIKITLPGMEPSYIFRDNVYVRNFFYLYRIKNKNKLNLDFGKIKLEFLLRCEKVGKKNYGKLMGMGSLATYHGVDQSKAGLYLEENLPADEKFLNRENQYDSRWRLYDDHFYSDLVALHEINGFKKTDIPIPESYKPESILDKDGFARKGVDGKEMVRMKPIDKQNYQVMGLWRKVETLTAARASQINNSDRVQDAMGVMYDFWNKLPDIDLSKINDSWSQEELTKHIMGEYQATLEDLEVPADETAETALGIPFTECCICRQPGSTVFLGRCSKNKDRPHCYHLSCLYDTIIKNPGTGGSSWQYKAINLEQKMSYITVEPGVPAQLLHRDGNLTIREFLRHRQNMFIDGKIKKEQSVTIPLDVDEAVPCSTDTESGIHKRRWFINAGKNHKRTVCGYVNDAHQGGDDWYKDVPMFKWRALLAGHADASKQPPFQNTGRYVDECGGQQYHGTVTMTPNTAKCSSCQMKFGSKIMCAFPKTRRVVDTDGKESTQYAGQEVTEYGADGLEDNLFFGEVPKIEHHSGGALDFAAYKHKYVLMKYEPFGRAEVEGTGRASHGGGSLELHIHDVASYLESRPYKNKNVSILYEWDRNIPQVLFPTPRLPGLEHPLIRKRKGEGGAKRQKKQEATKILYGRARNLAIACLDKAQGKEWKDNLMILFNKKDPTEDGKMDGPYIDEWRDARGGPWAVYDPQSEQVETGNSNSSTTKRPVETRIPGTGDVVELPVFASGPGGARMESNPVYNANFVANPDDIKRIEKWIKLVEEQVGALEQQARDEASKEYKEYVNRICTKYNCTSLATSGAGLRARFTVVPPGRPIKMNMDFPNRISLVDFITAVKNNIKPVPTKEKLEIYIPNDATLINSIQSISELTKKWLIPPTWPETITIEEDMLGTVVEVPIFEQDMELEWPDEDDLTPEQIEELRERVRKYNEVKKHPDINTVEVSKIEYMGERFEEGFPKVYEGKMPTSGLFYLKDKIKKPKMRQKPEHQDQLPWFTKEKIEQFMVRCKPKQLSQQAKRMKIEVAFVEEGNLDATIEVNKCNMIIDVPKDLKVQDVGAYMMKCKWFQNPNCWLHLDENGHPTLPDGRKLFKLKTMVSSSLNGFVEHPEAHTRDNGDQQLFDSTAEYDDDNNATFFSEDLRTAKMNLVGRADEQDSREEDGDAKSNDFDTAQQLDGSYMMPITFEDLINNTLDWPEDYEDDDWFWSPSAFGEWSAEKKKMYGELGILNPYRVSQLERHRKLEKFDPDCTKHGLSILIQVPKKPKYLGELSAGTTYEWNNGTNRIRNHLIHQHGEDVDNRLVVATVTFHEYNGATVARNVGQRLRVAIPVEYLMHHDGEDPKLPQSDGDRWRKLYDWTNLLSEPGRVFADDRFYLPGAPAQWSFDGLNAQGDQHWVDNIGQRGASETLAVIGQVRISTPGSNVMSATRHMLLAHESVMNRSFYTLIKKEDDEYFGKTYEEKFDVLPVSSLMPLLKEKSRVIPLSVYTQAGIKIRYSSRNTPSMSEQRDRVTAMLTQMEERGVLTGYNRAPSQQSILKTGTYNLAGGWGDGLTNGISGILAQTDEDPLVSIENVVNPSYSTAMINEDGKKNLLFSRNYELFIDVIRNNPRANDKPAVAPTRSIGFDFVVVGPHPNRNEYGYFNACGHDGWHDNIRHFRGSNVHKMYLPVEKNIQGRIGPCGFGFKDIHWHQFLQELPNIFCAEVAWDDNWRIKEKLEGEEDAWADDNLDGAEKLEILLDQVEYVGTMIFRDDRDANNTGDGAIKQVELFHLSPTRPPPYGDDALEKKHFELSVDEQEFVSLGVTPENKPIPHSHLYIDEEKDSTYSWRNTEDEFYLRKRIKAMPTSADEISAYGEATNGCMVAQSPTRGQAENYIFNPLNWTDKDENNNVYLNRACGVFKQNEQARRLPMVRGISRDGQGYNIQRALFGLNNSIDGWRNCVTADDLENGEAGRPHFVIGVRLKNPEKYRLKHVTAERAYNFNKHKEEEKDPGETSESSSSEDDDATVDNSYDGVNVYNLAIDANSSEQISNGVNNWPNVELGDIVHCAYTNPVYRVTRFDAGYVNLEQVEDRQQTVEDYEIEDLTFIHRAMTYPGRRHEIIRTATFCRIRMGSVGQAPGADAIQAGSTSWSLDPRYSEQVFRIERFGYGSRAPIREDFERIEASEDLPDLDDDDGPIGESHQIMLRNTLDAMTYRTFISVIAYCDQSGLRIFGPPDELDSDEDEAGEEDIMGHYTYENSNGEIKIGDIVMYQPHGWRTTIHTAMGTAREGTRFNVEDPREYSVVDILPNGDSTTFVIKLNMWTKLWDNNGMKKSIRMIGVPNIPMIQFKRQGYDSITMDTSLNRWETWRKMPLSVGTQVRRCTSTGAYLNDTTYIVTGESPVLNWLGHNDGNTVEITEAEIVGTGGQYGDGGVYSPKTGEEHRMVVNTNFLRWVGYQGVYHSNNYFTIGSKWNLQAQDSENAVIHEVIAVHREYVVTNNGAGQIDMRERFNGLVIRSEGPYAIIKPLDLDTYSGTIMRVNPDLYTYNDLVAKDWPIYENWEEPQDSAPSSDQSDMDEVELMDSRLSKITLKF